MFQSPLSFWGLVDFFFFFFCLLFSVFCWVLYKYLEYCLNSISLLMEMPSCAISKCCEWEVMGSDFETFPILLCLAHLWIMMAQWGERKGYLFKAKCFSFAGFLHTVPRGHGFLALRIFIFKHMIFLRPK